jgi:uncharacterized delta-60 repeat protein
MQGIFRGITLALLFFGLGTGSAAANVTVEVDDAAGGIWKLAVYPDGPHEGQVVALAGRSATGVRIFRFQTDGSLDPTFGRQGMVRLRLKKPLGTIERLGVFNALTIDEADRVLIGGRGLAGDEIGMIARLTPSGAPDPSFGRRGFWTGFTDTRIADVAVVPGGGEDGAILATSEIGLFNISTRVYRLTEAGVSDPTFGSQGVVTPFPQDYSVSDNLIIQPDGKLLLSDGLQLGRLESDGSLDEDFGTGGMTTVDRPLYGAAGAGAGLALYPSGPDAGKIVLAGTTGPFPPGDATEVIVAQLDSEGEPDADFDEDGIVTGDFSPRSDIATDATIDPEGRIVVASAGGEWVPEQMHGRLLRYLPDGSLDTTIQSSVEIPVAVVSDPYGPVTAGQRTVNWLGSRTDEIAPETWIDSGPRNGSVIKDRTPRFRFSSNDPNAHFLCRIDSADFEDCGSPITLDRLADGKHRFEVRARDGAGNQDATAALRRFAVRAG